MASSAATLSLLRQSKFLTLSFSGAGHLLPYHLGVATVIQTEARSIATPVEAVSGSSSGAIAAALFACFPARLDEYADAFIADGGRALHHFRDLADASRGGPLEPRTSLHVATTRCVDGAPHLFGFPKDRLCDKEHLLKCLRASCAIPPHFHPADVLPHRTPATYPDGDGVAIHGLSYVDGGIAAPAPRAHLDAMDGGCRVVISPISGGTREARAVRISPADASWKFPWDLECRGGFRVHPSVQNARALQVAAGAASSAVLREWYERGVEDGTRAFAE